MSSFASVYQWVQPDLPNGVESGSLFLADAFYRFMVFSSFETNQKLCSIRDRNELKRYYIATKKHWAPANSVTLIRHFDQVLYALTRYMDVCRVKGKSNINWKFVTMHLADVPQIDSEKVYNHLQVIVLSAQNAFLQSQLQQNMESKPDNLMRMLNREAQKLNRSRNLEEGEC